MLTPWVNMRFTDEIRQDYRDTSEAYQDISMTTPFIPLFSAIAARPVPESEINFDRNGILYEYGDRFFTLLEILTEDDKGTTIYRIRADWLPKTYVGPYMQQEWQSLHNIRLGAKGSAACGCKEDRWHAHSVIIQNLRYCIASDARTIHLNYSLAKQKPTDFVYINTLTAAFRRIVESYYNSLKIRDELAAKEAQSAMEEFMVPYEEL